METRFEAVVLAGGSGSRFGGGKLTAPWRGGALIDGALAAAFAGPVRTVTVVTGADATVAAAARTFAARTGSIDRLRCIDCPDHADGMGHTLRAGIAALPDDAVGAFVFLGDMPLIPPAILPKLADALASGAAAAAPMFEGQRGHPVLFSRELFLDLLNLSGDRGARDTLKALGDRLAVIDAGDAGILVDIDSPGDIDKIDSR
jgi:molybdenum cofactor cytidylyltransferase